MCIRITGPYQVDRQWRNEGLGRKEVEEERRGEERRGEEISWREGEVSI
jgi:hypothetical protein